MSDKTRTVLYTNEAGVARITLNRPERRNALNDQLVRAVQNAIVTAASAEYTRVIVISGAGKDFCSGADLSALQKISQASVAENQADASSLSELFLLIRRTPVPIVAAVRGKALAGGCGLASACDIVLASAEAQFGYPEVKIGFVPAMVMAILRRNVSEKRAFALVTRGEQISAVVAKEYGLVNQVFPEEEFESAVTDYVNGFAKMSRSALALTKTLLYQMDGMSFGDALQSGVDVNVIARMTEDCQEGIARFLKKT